MKLCAKQNNTLFLFRAVVFVSALAVLAMLCSCGQKHDNDSLEIFKTYLDIPGITEQEIAAIETLQKEHVSFIYGMAPSTEAFIDENGNENGYAALFCEWLSELFGIKFDLRILEWLELTEGLKSGDIDFSVHLMPDEENLENFLMTDPIAERQLIIARLNGSLTIDQVAQRRLPRYAFIANYPTESIVASVTKPGTYEKVWVNDYNEAYHVLETGEADAFITVSASEANFIAYDNVIHEDFSPLTFFPASMATVKPALSDVISVLNKALRNGAMPYLRKLYNTGYDEYKRFKFFMSLNEEEKAYLKNTASVPVAVQPFNYPIVFYDSREKKWDGIAIELLHKVQEVSGLSFVVANDKDAEMQELMQMLLDGRVYMFSDLIKTEEREKFFIWGNYKFMEDQYVLMSKTSFPNVSINEITFSRIALRGGTAHTDMFHKWFPNAVNTIEYDVMEDAFLALEKGEVDLLMGAKSHLLFYSNYYDFSGYKANYLFNHFYDSAFTFNKDQVILRSIIDKALFIIDTDVITEQWLTRTYDYRTRMLEARFPLLIGAVLLSLAVLALTLIVFVRSRQQSQKLRKERDRVRIMLDTLPIACFTGSVGGKIFDCNTEAVRLFELKDKEEFIKYFDKCLSPEFQPNGQSSYQLMLDYGRQTSENGKCVFNWTHQLLDGTPLPSLITLESVTYSGETLLMAYIRDMREHEKMSDEISRQNELLMMVNKVSSILLEPDIGHFEDSLKQSMKIIAKVVGVDRICIWINESNDQELRFSLCYQWENECFNTKSRDGKLAPDLCFKNFPFWNEHLSAGNCLNSMRSDMPQIEREELAARNIESVLAVPVFLQDTFWGFVGFDQCIVGQVYEESEVLIMRSVSRMMANAAIRNEMSIELVFAKEQAEQSNRSKSIFLSHMSHEIRTPMNAILGVAEIQLRAEQLSPVTEEAFGKIYESGDLLLNIINDILDLSKIEAGKLELVPVKYDIPSLINDTAQLNRLRYDSKPIPFSLHIDENTPLELFGDELRIKQVLNNVISNAFKYTDEGSVDFYVSAESADGNDEDVTLIFRIVDTGQGMTKSQLDRLFLEYTRFNLDINRTTVGAGLGMTITKRLVDLMSGEIIIKSEPGTGSDFTVRLPQKRIGAAVCGAEMAEKLQDSNFQSTAISKKVQFLREYMPYGSVLVVDDVDSNIYVTRGMLLPYGLTIDTATSGFEAIDKIKNGIIYDVIFMDHMMPKMDGIEAVRTIREMGYNHTIVALTANALIGREQMFLKNGFDGFISKPIDSRELNLVLNEFIRNKKPPEVVEAARKEQREKGSVHSIISEPNALEVKKLFIKDAKDAIKTLENIELEGEGLQLYIVTVHGIKSALANIGEKDLSKAALKLERAGEDKNFSVITKETLTFISSLKKLIDSFKTAKDSSDNKTDISEDDNIYLREKFLVIKSACLAFDKDTAKAALEEINQKKWPESVDDILDDISLQLLHSAFKKAAAIAESYITDSGLQASYTI